MRLGGAFLHPGLAFLPCKRARVTPSCPHHEGAGRHDAWDVVAPGIQIFFGSWNKDDGEDGAPSVLGLCPEPGAQCLVPPDLWGRVHGGWGRENLRNRSPDAAFKILRMWEVGRGGLAAGEARGVEP